MAPRCSRSIRSTRSVACPDGRYEVDYRRLDPDPAAPAVAGRVVGTKVVLAAGSLGSTRLLLVCRDRAATLPALSPAVGTRFSTNGEMLLALAKDSDRPVNPGLGPPITAKTTVTVGRHVVTVEDLGLPDSLLWFLEGATPPGRERLRRLVVLAWSYLRRSLGLGARPSRFSLELDALVAGAFDPSGDAVPRDGHRLLRRPVRAPRRPGRGRLEPVAQPRACSARSSASCATSATPPVAGS